MEKKKLVDLILIAGVLSVLVMTQMAFGISEVYKGNIYPAAALKPIDSVLKVKIGQPAPDFTLPSISGEKECCPLLRSCRLDACLFGSMAGL